MPVKNPVKSFVQGAFFESFYRFTTPPWVIDKAQPDLVQLVTNDGLKGSTVLDVGCGTGDNAVYLAQQGYEVVGIDFSASAIKVATGKAKNASLVIDFRKLDALNLSRVARSFDTVIDYGLFHQFTGQQLKQYVNSLAVVVKLEGQLIIQCFSDQESSRETGPNKVSQQAIYDAFDTGWQVNWIRPAKYHANNREPYEAWLTSITRVAV